MLGVSAIIRSTTGEVLPDIQELIIHTTSTSASWNGVLVNSGDPLLWKVSGGVTIAEQEYTGNTFPTLNLSSNTGTAIISIKTQSSFAGLTSISCVGTEGADNVIFVDVTKAIDLLELEIKLQPNLNGIDISNSPNLQNITLRDNNFDTIDVSNNPDILYTYVYGNNLTSYNILHTPLLISLGIDDNQLDSTQLDFLVNKLDEFGQINGYLTLDNNAGSLTSDAYTSYWSLKSKGWDIDVASPPEPEEVPPIEESFNPVLSDFHIKVGEPSRVYFSSNQDISTKLTDTNGFVVSGKSFLNSTAVTINGTNLTDHYFTMSTDFTFWDNNTIRLGEITDTVHHQDYIYNFTLEYIVNNLTEPSAGVNRFVSHNGTGSGLDENNPASITTAYTTCEAGQTWWCKAGDYGNQQFDFERDGTDTDPIKFIGYKTDWTNGGDITTNYWDNGVTWSTSEMPTFTGIGSGLAMDMNGSNYVIWKNFQYNNFNLAILGGEQNSNLIYDRLNIDCNGGSTGIQFASGASSTSRWLGNNNIRVLNSVIKDAEDQNLVLYGTGSCLIDNVKAYGFNSGVPGTDYLICFNGDNSICRRTYAGITDTGKEGHGIGVRGSYNMTNQYNLIEDCVTDNCIEGLYFRNYGTNNNVIKNCTVDDTVNSSIDVEMNGLAFMNYVSDNIFENITVKNVGRSVLFSVNDGAADNEQTGSFPNQTDIGSGNKLRNVVADGCLIGMGGFVAIAEITSDIPDFSVENCTLVGGTNAGLVYIAERFNLSGWEFKNTIIENWSGYGGSAPVMSYNNGVEITDRAEIAIDYARYFGNKSGWAPNGGTDNVSVDTQLDTNYVPQVDFSSISMPKLTMVTYDINGNERREITTVGAYAIETTTTLTPIMTNFRVLEATPNRVYFDAPLGPVTGANKDGFVISGKGVLAIDTSNNYFTVDADFTYWDNATIRLGENDNQVDVQNALHNFTLSYIDVMTDFTEPVTTVDKYVAATAQGSGDGSSEANAATFATAVANCSAGQTWWLKAGLYSNQFVYLSGKNGTATNPIKFKGYKNTIGDITSNYIQDYNDIKNGWSTSEMPTLTGATNYTIGYRNSNYIFFENIQISNGNFGIQAIVNDNDSNNLVLRRINGKTIGKEFISMQINMPVEEGGDGYKTWNNADSKVLDCRSLNCTRGHGVKVYGTGRNLIDQCKVWSDLDTVETHQDYFISFNGWNNIIRRCYTEFLNSVDGINSHGISLRGTSQLSNNYNLVDDSTAINSVEGFAIRNYGCNYNVIKNCFAGNDKNDANDPKARYGSGGFSIWGGVDYNIVERCQANNTRLGLDFIDNQEESNHTSDYIGTGNIIRNSIFYNNHYTININAQNGAILADTKIINCTFDNGSRIFERGGSVNNTNMELINCQFTRMESQFTTTGATYSYSNFFDNGGDFVGSGTENTRVDPNYEDTIDFVPQTEMWVPINTAFYDYNNEERESTTTIGAVKHDNEVPILSGVAVLSQFTIEQDTPAQVNFVASNDVTGMVETGFVISNNSISSVTINEGGLSGYFTVGTAYDFWDNGTIRLGANNSTDVQGSILHNFTLQHIENNMVEPSATNFRYVTTNGSGNGATIDTPANLSYALSNAVAGETWWIKAGLYVRTYTGEVQNTGTKASPIKFIGYKDNIGDLDGVTYWTYPNTLNSADAPLITDSGVSEMVGLGAFLKTGIIFRNIQTNMTWSTGTYPNWSTLDHGSVGFNISGCNGVIIDNCVNDNENGRGYGFLGWESFSTFVSNYRLINSSQVACRFQIWAAGTYNLIDNCKSYSGTGTSYLCQMEGDHNIVKNTELRRYVHNPTHSGHGINFNIINMSETSHNLCEDVIVTNSDKAIEFRKGNSHDNVCRRMTVNNTGSGDAYQATGGPVFRDGSYNNIFEDGYVESGVTTNSAAMRLEDSGETGVGLGGSNNTVRNTVFKNNTRFWLESSQGAQVADNFNFIGNTIINQSHIWYSPAASQVSFTNSNFKNNIVIDSTNFDYSGLVDSGLTVDQNLWYNNDFATPGLNPITGINPLLDSSYKPQATFTDIDVPRIDKFYYDRSKKERDEISTTVGAENHTDEIIT